MNYSGLSCVYGIGKYAKTKEYSLFNPTFWIPIEKQDEMSLNVISSVTLKAKRMDQEQELFSIYVGKEIFLEKPLSYYSKKYDISLDELIKLKKQGYDRICLLDYKKYDNEVIGLEENDRVVPSYSALKEKLRCMEQIQKGTYQK